MADKWPIRNVPTSVRERFKKAKAKEYLRTGESLTNAQMIEKMVKLWEDKNEGQEKQSVG